METSFGQWLLVDAIFQKREFYQKKGLQRSTKNVQENSPRKRTSCGHFFQENSPKVPKRIHPFVSIKNVITDRLNHPISSDKIYHISKRFFFCHFKFCHYRRNHFCLNLLVKRTYKKEQCKDNNKNKPI